MKILVIHQFYLMPGQSGGSRFNEFARMWTEAGHQVTVIAGTVHYATGERPERYRGKWITREKDGRVSVWRCHVPDTYRHPHGPGSQGNFRGRMWAFFGFTLSAATAALLERDADVVIATSPPLIAPIPGWVAARLRRKSAQLIFEIRDLWPESAVTTGVLSERSPLTRLLYQLERWACRTADKINVLTPAFEEDLIRRGLASHEKIVFVPNGADLAIFAPGPRDNLVRAQAGWDDRFVVLYCGAHGRANAVRQLLDAAERLRDRPDILIATVGDGPERRELNDEISRRGLTNVIMHGPQPKERMSEWVNACDVGAAVLQNNPTFKTVYPNKIFDYMACARPILLAIDGVARKLVCDDAQAGVFSPPEDGPALAETIRRLADAPQLRAELGARGRTWVLANATREALAERYLGVMQEGPRPSSLRRGWSALAQRIVGWKTEKGR